jgi:sterol 3beta-glucosyltransferase
MVITILATGSRGDIQPYIALGIQLNKEGHQVKIATFENYADFVMSYGLGFSKIRGDIIQAAASNDAKSAIQADNPLKILLSFNKLKSLVFDLQQDYFDACVDSDAVIYHPGAAIGYFAAQYLKIPSILAAPFPMAHTQAYPALIFYGKVPSGKKINLLTHKIFEQIMWSASRGPVKQFLKERFGELPKNFGNPFSKQNTLTHPTVFSCSNHVFPIPDDRPKHIHSAGYWFLEHEAKWTAPDELITFLNEGNPPVYVGFGSLGDPEKAGEMTRLVIDALHHAGQRGVLATGWQGMAAINDLPEDIFILKSAPHTWLFPRMAAVVHHGGAGTTAAGLRAGIPSIIIPFSNDQFSWGQRIYELGVGPKPIPRKKLTSENLSKAICAAFDDRIIHAAEELGKKVRSENGAKAITDIILKNID